MTFSSSELKIVLMIIKRILTDQEAEESHNKQWAELKVGEITGVFVDERSIGNLGNVLIVDKADNYICVASLDQHNIDAVLGHEPFCSFRYVLNQHPRVHIGKTENLVPKFDPQPRDEEFQEWSQATLGVRFRSKGDKTLSSG